MGVKNKTGDEELVVIRLAQKGDEKAYLLLISLYKDRIYRYCYFLSKNAALAEDLTQETFVRVFKNIHKLEKAEAFRGWIYAIACRIYFDYKKLKKNKDHVSYDDLAEQGALNNKAVLKNAIEMVLETLEPDEKQALLLIDLAENSHEEAAAIMGTSKDSTRWKLREARRKFIEYFKKHEIEVTGLFVLPTKKESA